MAAVIGVHPNTIRMYEEIGFITKTERKENGYRVFTSLHIMQVRLIQVALRIPIVQSGLRKRMILLIREMALGHIEQAIIHGEEYIKGVNAEIDNAKEAAQIVQSLIHTLLGKQNFTPERSGIYSNARAYSRKEVLQIVDVKSDTLRNWERNGLIEIHKKENGYHDYSEQQIRQIRVVRALRCANYSLTSILRMVTALEKEDGVDIVKALNEPSSNEEVVSVCDKLIISLESARENGYSILELLYEMNRMMVWGEL